MTNRFDEAAQLKVLTGRRDAIIEREQNPCSPNCAILERIKIERDLLEAAHWLTEVARCFQKGDADLLYELIAYINFLIPSGMEAVEVGDEEFEVLLDDQKLLIRAKDHLFRMLAAAKIMEEKL